MEGRDDRGRRMWEQDKGNREGGGGNKSGKQGHGVEAEQQLIDAVS